MKTLTRFLAWLIGYYYDECPVCGRYVAILGNGTFVDWCDKRKHARIDPPPSQDTRTP